MELGKSIQLIMCQNHEEFAKYCAWKGVRTNDAWVREVESELQLRGLRNCEVVYFGNYWLHPLFGHWLVEEVQKTQR